MAALELTVNIQAGAMVADKYRIEKVLGTGGMGVVFAARHLQLDELVAIKFLAPQVNANANAVNRFTREARASVRIKSEHVARVIDVGQLGNGAPYIVMEYLEGSNLAQWLIDRGPLPVTLAVELILQACEAIAEAHSLGIVHRDLKPANLFCVHHSDGSPSVKVLDFGISKVERAGALDAPFNLTESACLLGSPFYMSPEQFRSARDVDACTDLWSLGIILFELLSGRTPFRADSVPELYHSMVTQPTPSVLCYRADVPEKLNQVIQRCLAKSQTQRYQNVAALAADLAPFASKRAKLSVARILGTAGETPRTTNPSEETSNWHKRPSLSESRSTTSGWDKAVLSPRPGRGLVLLGAAFVLCVVPISWAFMKRDKLAASTIDDGTFPNPRAIGTVNLNRPLSTLNVAVRDSLASSGSGMASSTGTAPTATLLPRERSAAPSKQHSPRSGPRVQPRSGIPTTAASVRPPIPNENLANRRSVYDDMD